MDPEIPEITTPKKVNQDVLRTFIFIATCAALVFLYRQFVKSMQERQAEFEQRLVQSVFTGQPMHAAQKAPPMHAAQKAPKVVTDPVPETNHNQPERKPVIADDETGGFVESTEGGPNPIIKQNTGD